MTDKEVIKKEIEKRIEQCYRCLAQDLLEIERKETNCCLQQYKELLQFIDSLPVESGCEVNFTTKNDDLESQYKSNMHYQHAYTQDDLMKNKSEDLEKAASEYVREDFRERSRADFKAGAEWQKQKDQETIELAEDHAMLAGMMKEREKMMKDTVEGTVKYEIGSAEIPQCDRRYQVLSDPTSIANTKLGDKVKIIIVKTEQ